MFNFQSKKLKKYLSLFVILLMMLSTNPSFNSFSADNEGISEHWAKQTILSWLEKGFISGYPDGSLRPDNNITRAEFMTLANKAFGYTQKTSMTFSDVKTDAWYANAISIARAAGYISGYPDGTMRPENLISREEVASIIMKIKMLEADPVAANIFEDSSSLTWSKGAIGAVAKTQSMNGYPDNTFAPHDFIKRGEAIVALDQAEKYIEVSVTPKASSAPSESKVTATTKAPSTTTTKTPSTTTTKTPSTSPTTTTTKTPSTATTIPSTPIVADAHYVSLTGSDSNAGTAEAPWRTIQKAANTASAGDTVYIRSGVYNESVTMNVSGTSGNPITFTAYNGENVTIDARNQGIPINLNKQGFITIKDLSVKNSTYQGIGDMSSASPGNYSLGAHDIIIQNCQTDSTFSSGIGFNSGKNITIDNCTIQNANIGMDQEALTISSVDGFTLSNNELLNNRKENIDIKDGSKNGKIYSNYIHSFDDDYQWGTPAIYLDCFGMAQSNIEIYNNTIKDTAGGSITTGIMVSNEVTNGGNGMTNINIHDNMITGTDYGFLVEWGNYPEASQWPLSNLNYHHNTHEGVRYLDVRVRVGTGYAENCYLQNNTFSGGSQNISFENGEGGWAIIGNS